jgi:hypothetical protein
MPGESTRPDRDVDGEGKGLALLGIVGSRLLESLSNETLSELARVLLFLGGITAALAAWGFGDWLFAHATRWLGSFDAFALRWCSMLLRGPVSAEAVAQSHIGVYTQQTVLIFGLLGGVFTLLGGVAGGLTTRSASRMAKAGAWGLLGGALFCGVICLLVVPLSLGLIIRTPDTRISIATHAVIDSSAAAACGFVVGLAAKASLKEAFRLLAAGVLGAALGALIFGIVQIFCFPFESEFVPIPRSSLCRLIEYACATVVPAVCIAVVLVSPPAAEAGGDEAAL